MLIGATAASHQRQLLRASGCAAVASKTQRSSAKRYGRRSEFKCLAHAQALVSSAQWVHDNPIECMLLPKILLRMVPWGLDATNFVVAEDEQVCCQAPY